MTRAVFLVGAGGGKPWLWGAGRLVTRQHQTGLVGRPWAPRVRETAVVKCRQAGSGETVQAEEVG